MNFFISSFAVLMGLVCVDAARHSYGTPVVAISDGIILGTTTTLPTATSVVNKYLGIPYAKADRFAAPTAAASWTQPLNATQFGPTCIQLPAGNLNVSPSNVTVPESEECLSLNVWQPGGAPPEEGWPVMVWIHGGGLIFGSSREPYYDGSAFAAYEDVIVVSFNYRLNVFGFAYGSGLPANASNLGFQDQRFALQWVQKNIDAFDGNKDAVTIFGESSGSISVNALISTPPNPLPFRGAIMESGNIIGNNLANITANITGAWSRLVSGVNCSTAANTLTCIRSVNATVLKSYVINNNLSFTAIKDDNTLAANSSGSYLSGVAAKVPVLIGTNANEGTLFTLGQNNLTSFINSQLGFLPDLANTVIKEFGVGTPGYTSDTQAIAQFFTEIGLQCPAALQANQSFAAGIPTWRYYYNTTFPNLLPSAALGVFHSSEIPLVFTTYSAMGATPQQYALSNYMRGAWARFARNPKGGPGWNAVGTYNGTNLGVLGTSGSGGVQVVSPQGVTGVDRRCSLFQALYTLTN